MALAYRTRAILKGSHQVPLIRKVIRIGVNWTCGLCRRKHPHEDPALECLDSCWTDVLTASLVIDAVFKGQHQFKCRLCCRLYDQKSDCETCCKDCLGTWKQKHYADMKIFEIPISEFEREKYNFAVVKHEVKADYVSRFNLRRKGDEGETPDNSVNEEPDNIGEEVVVEEKPVRPRRAKTSFKKPWIRRDAKYECQVCKELYFTRLEADKCFDGHFDEAGLEIFETEVLQASSNETQTEPEGASTESPTQEGEQS